MYNWNGIKINIEGNARDFISQIKKYFYAQYIAASNHDYDINVSINISDHKNFRPPGPEPEHIRTLNLLVDREIRLDIYDYKHQICYIYDQVARVLIDLRENNIIVNLAHEIFYFAYYNILLFFLNPLGTLLQNFGFNRAHSSCAYIQDSVILFTGISSCGKSTSAFAIAINGGGIISDDITYFKKVDGHFTAYTVSSLAKLRHHSVHSFFPELLNYKYLKNDEGEFYFSIYDINAEPIKTPRVKAIVILNKTKMTASGINPVHPTKVIPHIFPSSIRPGSHNTDRNFNFLTELLDKVHCYRVDFGTDMHDFYLSIKKILDDQLL